MSLPATTKSWFVSGNAGFDSLKLEQSAVSLNYRDLLIANGLYPTTVKKEVVPGSDGAGNVIAVGSKVIRFTVGDKVCTQFTQAHQAGHIQPSMSSTSLGGRTDGTLRQYAVFDETGLVRSPSNLTQTEAGTLTCAALTAWNALYGLEGRVLKPGQAVLTQGTGGVSIAALQFAVAAGAIVIATTSSEAKMKKLKELGAHHVINYSTTPNWGEEAKKLSPGGLGVDHILEIGGENTMEQSLKAIKMEGVISVIGFVGGKGEGEQTSMLRAIMHGCIVRGVLVGSRMQFEEMNRAIEANNIRPVVDKIFEFEDLKAAYQYTWDQKHFGKVVVGFAKL